MDNVEITGKINRLNVLPQKDFLCEFAVEHSLLSDFSTFRKKTHSLYVSTRIFFNSKSSMRNLDILPINALLLQETLLITDLSECTIWIFVTY